MAEVAGLVVGVIGLAALFENGIKAFDAFKSALHAEAESDDLLCKLDLEKMRLLVWGDQVGILKEHGAGRNPYLDTFEKEIQRSLTKMHGLLSNAEELREKYGVREIPEEQSTSLLRRDVFSRNGMRLHLSNWLAFISKNVVDRTRLGPTSRTAWVLRDKGKFRQLLNDLREHIDSLNQMIHVPWSLVEQIIEGNLVDAAFGGDLTRLRMVEQACEGTYSTLALKAKTIISQSEAGTLDRRDETEVLEDETPLASLTSPPVASANESSLGLYLPSFMRLIFAVTDACPNQGSTVCSPDSIVESTLHSGRVDCWPLAYTHPRNHLGRRIYGQTDLSGVLLLDQHKVNEILLKKFEDPMDIPTPVANVMIYCPPCARQILTGAQICSTQGLPRMVEFLVRVDDRLHCSCLNADERRQAVYNLAENTLPAERASRSYIDPICRHIDFEYVDQRAYEIETEGIFSDQSIAKQYRDVISGRRPVSTPCAAVVVLSEVQDMCQVMNQPPFEPHARMPRASELYEMSGMKRRYLGKV